MRSRVFGSVLVILLGVILFLITGPVNPAYAHGDLHEQIDMVSRSIEIAPTAELFLKRGELHRAHQDFPAALADYDRAEAQDAKLEIVHLARGRALLEAGRHADAVKALSRFLESRPDYALAYIYRARATANERRFQQAIVDYDRGISLSAALKPDLFLERADILIACQKHTEALSGLEQGISKLGSLVTLETAALKIEVDLQRYEAALARVDRLLSSAQRKELWLERKAVILTHAGRNIEAKNTYNEALASLFALPERFRSLRATQEMEKRIREALAVLSRKPS